MLVVVHFLNNISVQLLNCKGILFVDTKKACNFLQALFFINLMNIQIISLMVFALAENFFQCINQAN